MSEEGNSARDLAVKMLGRWARSGTFADAILSETMDSSNLQQKDCSLVAELFLGVLRRRESLDCVLRTFCSRPLKRIGRGVLNILRVGAYQIIFLERVPSYAAVDSAVRQAKKFTGGGVHKMVNAVLRNVDRSLAHDFLQSNEQLFRRALPLAVGKWRYFNRDILAGTDDDPGLHISQVYSCPAWLGRRWWGRFDLEGAGAVALASVLRGPATLRPNLLRTNSRELLDALENLGLRAGLMNEGAGVWVEQINLTQNQLFQVGHFQPQGPTAIRVAEFAQVQPGQRVLDFCAGLGTKATGLAELMGNEGLVVASDISQEKLRRAQTNAKRLGTSCIEFVIQRELAERFGEQAFDVVLVDAPCSNTGVLANRPDVKWRITERDLAQLAEKQMKILRKAIGFVRPGGSLIYSTCSIEPVENDELTARLNRDYQEIVAFEADKQYLPRITEDPAGWHDGGYMARWRKK